MVASFRPAQRKNILARLAICGPTGAGKTFTALGVAITLADGGRVAVIDTERSSSDRYADKFSFDACQLDCYSPEAYMEAIEAATTGGYAVLVIDSLSHAWDGAEGLLERVDSIAKRSKSGNTFSAWGEATPLHRRLIDAILSFPGHVIVTMRSRMEYVLETNDRGKQIPRKVGMAPVQRQGLEYEFDIVGDMDQEHNLVITKSRAFDLADKVVNRPGKKFAQEILAWARGGDQKKPEQQKPEPEKKHEPKQDAAPSNPTPAPATSAQQIQAPAPAAPSAPVASTTTTPSTPMTPASDTAPATKPGNGTAETVQTGAEIAAQYERIRSLGIRLGLSSQDERKDLIEAIVKRPIPSMTRLTREERGIVIDRMAAMLGEDAKEVAA